MSTRKVLGLTLASVPTVGSLTACGGGGIAVTAADAKVEATTAAGDAKVEGDAATDATGADSGEEKTLHVAMECAYAPYNRIQPDDPNGAVAITDNNEFAYGHDVVMAERICEEPGYDLEVMRLDRDSLIPAVTTGQIDYVIVGQSITSERPQTVDFIESYYYATVVTLVEEGSKYAGAKSVADLAGVTCTSQQSIIWYNTYLPQIQDVNILAATVSTPNMLISSNADKYDLVVTNQFAGKRTLIAHPNLKVTESGGGGANFQATDEDINIGISLEKGDTELKDVINSILTEMTRGDFSKMMDEVISVQPLANQTTAVSVKGYQTDLQRSGVAVRLKYVRE